MVTAFAAVRSCQVARGYDDLRSSAFALALQKVAQVYSGAGIFP